MKKLLLSLLIASAFFISGCFDIVEQVNIGADGSGTYVTKMDLSKAMDMLEMMAASAESGDSKKPDMFSKDLDSTIRLADVMNSSDKEISAEKRELMKDGVVRIITSKADRKFLVEMKFPFNSFETLNKLASMQENDGMMDMFGSALGQKGDKDEKSDLPPMGKTGKTTFTNGLISREVSKEAMDALKNNPEMAGLGEQTEMLESMTITTEINLPRPVKSATGTSVKVSDDKRRITVSTNMKAMLENPASLSFKVEY